MFTAQELQSHLTRIERERHENDLAALEDDEPVFENSAAAAKRVKQFDAINELLTTTALVRS